MSHQLSIKTYYILLNAVFLIGLCSCSPSGKSGDDSSTPEQTALKLSKSVPAVIYRSTDVGRSWMPFANGISQEATVSSFLIRDETIYASTDDHGIYHIKEGETSWHKIETDLPDHTDINAIANVNNVFIIGTFRNGILISNDGGLHWMPSINPLNHTAIRALLSMDDMVFAGTDDGIYKSTDFGTSWRQVYKGVQTNGFTEMHNKIYAALMNGAIMTQDGGENWNYIYKPNTLHDISNDGESIYAMTLGAGLLKSKDDGQSWTNINSGLEDFYTFEVKSTGSKIFAGQWHGIYSSGDGGGHWQLLKRGLPDSTAFTTVEVTSNGLIAGIGLRKK